MGPDSVLRRGLRARRDRGSGPRPTIAEMGPVGASDPAGLGCADIGRGACDAGWDGQVTRTAASRSTMSSSRPRVTRAGLREARDARHRQTRACEGRRRHVHMAGGRNMQMRRMLPFGPGACRRACGCPWIRVWGSWRARRRCRAWWSPACRRGRGLRRGAAGSSRWRGRAASRPSRRRAQSIAWQHSIGYQSCAAAGVAAASRRAPGAIFWTCKSPRWSLLCSPPLEFVSALVRSTQARCSSAANGVPQSTCNRPPRSHAEAV